MDLSGEGEIDLAAAFAPEPPRALALEIGFGGGEHLVAQAAAHPDWGFIGAEPFVNGVGSCLRHIEAAGVANVRLHHGDARDVLARLPARSLTRVYLLFPDPWPKARHAKRRLVQPDFVATLARVLAPGGEVRFATDWRAYAEWTAAVFAADPAFAAAAEGCWPDHAPTRYEAKRLGDMEPVFFSFVHNS